MKIAITGGNCGLGASFAKVCIEHGHIVDVLSRSTGHDINDVECIASTLNDHDLLINNAYSVHAQTNLLYRIFSQWQGQKKYIINIGSELSTRMIHYTPEGSRTLISSQHQRDPIYRTAKVALEDAQRFLSQQNDWPKMQLIRPGLLDTMRKDFVPVNNDNRMKIDTSVLANWVYQTWINKENFWLSEVTVRPLDWYRPTIAVSHGKNTRNTTVDQQIDMQYNDRTLNNQE